MRKLAPWAVATALLTAGAASPILAQELGPLALDEVLAPVQVAELAGETWFGLHRHGESVGTLRLTLVADGAALRARVVSVYTLEGVAARLEEEARLEGPTAPTRLRQTAREGDGPPEEVVAERRGEELVVQEGEHRWRAQGPQQVLGQAGRLVLALALQRAGAPPGRYETSELSLEQERARPLEVRVEALPDRPAARRVVFAPRADPADAWEVVVGPEGALEMLGRRGDPGLVYLRARDEAHARADRPGAGEPPAGSPRAVVLEYLRGLVRGDAARVEATVDWPALFAALGAADVHPDVDAFRRAFLAGLARAGAEMELGADDIDALGPSLTETVAEDGVRAWVTIPGEDHRVKLGRAGTDGPWRIHSLVE